MPKSKPESLDDLLTHAEHYAESTMRVAGKTPPTLLLISPDGPVMCVADSLADVESKDTFAAFLRLICIAHAATAAVTILESWATFARPGETLDPAELPSEAFDRQEVVVLMGESQNDRKQRFLPIIRSGNGKFFGFGEANTTSDKLEGRFARIFSLKPPSLESRAIAQALLRAKGVKARKLKSRNS
jgi:hypothetical protein